ncbi:MAG: hypothetical protein GEU78_13170 [Actinobacteria bacterium]|nr:hypothetical protein [Actinomycetota bacterium]
MDDLVTRRRIPFVVVGTVVAVVAVAIFRLPELFVSGLRRDAMLPGSSGIWGFRILLVVAVGQVLFGGYRVLRTERLAAIEGERISSDPRRDRLASTVAWVAAGMVGLTLAYGVATFVLTGLRAGFWAFLALIVAQGLWYYRLAGDAARWLGRRPAPPAPLKPAWERGDADYTPPLARGLGPPPGAPAA